MDKKKMNYLMNKINKFKKIILGILLIDRIMCLSSGNSNVTLMD